MNNPTETLSAISSLLSAFPGTHSDPEGAVRGYIMAVQSFEPQDVREAVRRLIAGQVAEHDGRYCPTPPQLARATRKALEDRLDATRDRRPALPKPDIKRSEESRARVAALMAEHIEWLVQGKRTEDAEADRRRRELMAKTNARFQPDMSPEAQRQRLVRPQWYEVGDPDGEMA